METQSRTPQKHIAALRRIRLATKLLEGVIPVPGTGKKVGVDPIIGLFTGGGDSIGFIMSAYILLESLRFKLPKATLIKMLGNVATDAIVGAVPFLGDVFDFFWQSNTKNLKLLEAHLDNPQPQTAADKGFVILVFVALVILFIVAIGLTIAVASLLAGLLQTLTG
ncbi:DUF4112 domain-containing protein [filamentous cyanobacterium LEGE 11480]|uniref:DUF4112 domain-containing protein n=1 Tax=Romeriopsis navalis LEGE 11480 TaxID=2777977 RepID=A0A928VGW4_9CYAN|nr:DUF4112 domain-containing protein [Romeriopsis navalis]MBE9028378.1 DUF4112 domain-containing protein [Romeriopsis navalis LEGE 11480]